MQRSINNHGYTLVEVMIAATLLAIIVLGTSQYFVLSRWEIEKGIRSQLAWANMASRMEKAIDLGFISLQDSLSESSVSLTLSGIQGYRSTIVTAIDDSSDGLAPADTTIPDMMRVVINFAWFSPENISDSLVCVFSNERTWTY
ncbi:MAG: prepilin-type N-terminal cleavage/methylation domain-containing protein [FCB group bacterium]|nr:prepilin-type N-terminal cleavage/methylation domain-containing protein [FCB group bacterium]MBL7120965.1 prepilin-type N-terminal cleavage/methylation domain-containing protein [Candidatus Neomarinimicrobiota bacterium]